MTVSMELVKELRQRTGAGIVDCKKALQDAEGDINKAIELLRKKGIAKAEKKAGRSTTQGIVASYIHAGGKAGAIVEINCETDFVAMTEDFKNFAREVAMQVVAMKPSYVSVEDVPDDVIEKEKEILREQAVAEGKPESVVDKIVEGRLGRFFSEQCLLEQPWIKDGTKKISDLVKEHISKLGENINIKRFCRFQVGE